MAIAAGPEPAVVRAARTRALANGLSVLLLDEPAARLEMSICDRVVVLDFGQVEGSGDSR